MSQENSDVVFVGESRRKRARVEPIPERDWIRMADRIGERVSEQVSHQVVLSLSSECLECEEKDNRIRELERLLSEKTDECEELRDRHLCRICVVSPPNRIFACGHVFCSDCSTTMEARCVGDLIRCPTCRTLSYRTDIRRVFLE